MSGGQGTVITSGAGGGPTAWLASVCVCVLHRLGHGLGWTTWKETEAQRVAQSQQCGAVLVCLVGAAWGKGHPAHRRPLVGLKCCGSRT